jgi:hypothetical protein
MRVPRNRVELAQTHEGRAAEAGWVVVNIRGLELEGVTKLYVNMDEVESMKQKRDDVKSKLSQLFGDDDDDDFG